MKAILALFLTIMMMFIMIAPGQSARAQLKPPKEIVEEFWKLEVEGSRLTPQGWLTTAGFFVHPIPPSLQEPLVVVAKDFGVSQAKLDGKHADVLVFDRELGSIVVPRLQFKRPAAPPAGLPRVIKTARQYHLVLTNRYSQVQSDGKTKEVEGPLEWRLEECPVEILVSLDTAIRYVTEMRDKTTDPMIKKNADETLMKLKKLH